VTRIMATDADGQGIAGVLRPIMLNMSSRMRAVASRLRVRVRRAVALGSEGVGARVRDRDRVRTGPRATLPVAPHRDRAGLGPIQYLTSNTGPVIIYLRRFVSRFPPFSCRFL